MEKKVYSHQKENLILNVAIVYPNTYYIGMSSLGFQYVYHLLDSHPNIRCERAFVDKNEIRTVETSRSINEFDIVMFSLAFEGDLPNIIRALLLSGIELDPEKRKAPFVVTGGIGVSFLGGYLARISDILVPSDASLVLPSITEILLSHPDKEPRLALLEKIQGVFSYKTASQTMTFICETPLSDTTPPHSSIITENTEFNNRALMEISKSCSYNCAFCILSSVYGKYRHYNTDKILETAERFSGITDRIGLIAGTLTNHPDFKTIIKELNRRNFSVSFSSFRIEAIDNELLELIINNENKTLVIAPETASLKLQKLIRKAIPRETILQTVRKATAYGFKRLKLYFLIGLPGETYEDLDEIVSLVEEIYAVSKENARELGFTPEIIVDINPFVPKPFTELAGSKIEEIKSLKKKILYLKKRLHSLGRVFVSGESPRRARLQYEIGHNLLSFDELKNIALKD
jgi:radical SAM superfamily enzyme YgiQ (UPF0313 family)